MKTLTSIFFQLLNQQSLCVSKQWFSWWALPSRSASRLRFIIQSRLVRVYRASVASLTALILSLETNKRIYVAVTLMLLIAPLSSISYLLFDSASVDTSWYYQSYYNLFYVISPRLFEILTCTGVYLLFAEGSKRAWFLLIPIGLSLAKILWLITVSSNEEFHQVVPVFFLVLAGLISAVWLFTFDWMMHLHFHWRQSKISRAEGILMSEAFDDATARRMAVEQLQAARKQPA
jgi:hypothetical protein